jgi:hypothetical protein
LESSNLKIIILLQTPKININGIVVEGIKK